MSEKPSIITKFTSNEDFTSLFERDGLVSLSKNDVEVTLYFKSAKYKREGSQHEVEYFGVRKPNLSDIIRAIFWDFRRCLNRCG
jgi:hypothetical protein